MVKKELLANKPFFKFTFVVITTVLTIIYTIDYLSFNPVDHQEDFNHKLYWMAGAVGIAGISAMLLMFLAFIFDYHGKRRDKLLILAVLSLSLHLYLSKNLEVILLPLIFAFFAFIFSDRCLGRNRPYDVFLVVIISITLSAGAFGVELVLWNLFMPALSILLSLSPSKSGYEPAGLEYLEILMLFLLFTGVLIVFLRRIDSILGEK